MRGVLLFVGLTLAAGGGLFGWSIGAVGAAARITAKPTTFVSSARVSVLPPETEAGAKAVLVSDDLARRCVDRLRALYPGMSEARPELTVNRVLPQILAVESAGFDPDQVKAYLESLLAEAQAFGSEEALVMQWATALSDKQRQTDEIHRELRNTDDPTSGPERPSLEARAERLTSEMEATRELLAKAKAASANEIRISVIEPPSAATERIGDWGSKLTFSRGAGAALGMLPGLLLCACAMMWMRRSEE